MLVLLPRDIALFRFAVFFGVGVAVRFFDLVLFELRSGAGDVVEDFLGRFELSGQPLGFARFVVGFFFAGDGALEHGAVAFFASPSRGALRCDFFGVLF